MFRITRDYITSKEEKLQGLTWRGIYRYGDRCDLSCDLKEAKERWEKLKLTRPVCKFRLLDGDGIVYLYGENFNSSSFAMQEYFENLLGIVSTEFFEDGEWKML